MLTRMQRQNSTDNRKPQRRLAAAVPANYAVLSFPVALAALVCGAIAMGASPVFVRQAEVGPFISAFWRVALGLPVLLIWAWGEAKFAKRTLKIHFDLPVLYAGLFFAGDLIFWHLAIVHTTMANATLMSCLAPLWVLLFSGMFIGETVPRKSFYGLGVCLAGAAMLIGSSYNIDPSRILGDIYGFITSLFFGLYFLAARVGRRNQSSGAFLFASTVITAAILLIVAIIAGGAFLPHTLSGYFSLASLGIISHAGGQGLLAIALGSLTAAFSSLVIFIEAIAAAILGWILFGEAMGGWQFFGAALVLGGIWIARPGKSS